MSRYNQTLEERELFAERRRLRNKLKHQKRRAKAKAAALAAGAISALRPGMSKTDPTYRRRLPSVPEMLTKADMRAFLTQAVRNTQGAEA
jgi:hypothetical protein